MAIPQKEINTTRKRNDEQQKQAKTRNWKTKQTKETTTSTQQYNNKHINKHSDKKKQEKTK